MLEGEHLGNLGDTIWIVMLDEKEGGGRRGGGVKRDRRGEASICSPECRHAELFASISARPVASMEDELALA